MDQKTKSTMLTVVAVIFAGPALFFTWYTLRLIYLNLTMEDAAARRTGGMLIGAVVFPLAAIVFGLISWFCFRTARRGISK